MSYYAVGITDMDLIYKAPTTSESWGDPFATILDAIKLTGQSIENALTDPRVQQFMREAGIKAEEVKVEKKRREQKSNMLLWGGVAVGVAFLLFRKK